MRSRARVEPRASEGRRARSRQPTRPPSPVSCCPSSATRPLLLPLYMYNSGRRRYGFSCSSDKSITRCGGAASGAFRSCRSPDMNETRRKFGNPMCSRDDDDLCVCIRSITSHASPLLCHYPTRRSLATPSGTGTIIIRNARIRFYLTLTVSPRALDIIFIKKMLTARLRCSWTALKSVEHIGSATNVARENAVVSIW